MKPILRYYGGKQNMLRYIMNNIPEHYTYIEPFIGGGALFFEKEPSKAEIINDTNDLIINFYKQAKESFEALKIKIESALRSRTTYNITKEIYNNPKGYSDIDKAWAVWVQCNQSIRAIIGSGWDCRKLKKSYLPNYKRRFNEESANRLDKVCIENRDALEVLVLYSSDNSFCYVDPPYVGSVMGHYKGYTDNDYEKLLIILKDLKGKWLLSSYPSDILDEYIKDNDWYTIYKRLPLIASQKAKKELKTEVLTANYPLKKRENMLSENQQVLSI